MSDMQYSRHMDTSESEAIYTAQRTRDIMDGVKIGLIEAIEYNLDYPNPFHKNFPLTTTMLRMERENVRNRK